MNRSWNRFLRAVFSHRRTAIMAVTAAALLVYANSLGNSFAYDDTDIVAENEAIHSLGTLPSALLEPYWPSFGRELGLWRPVTTGVLGLQWALWGGNPVGFHLVNVLLHATASVLVLLLLAELVPLAAAVAGALVFAVHPVHVEAVANVVGIAELLAAVFFLAACLVFVRRRVRLGAGALAAITGLYAAAVFTKESAVTLPGALLLLDAACGELDLRDPRAYTKYLKRRAPLFLALAAVAGLLFTGRARVLGTIAHPFPPLGADVLQEVNRLWTVVSVWPHYVRLLFFPADLSADYAPLVIPVAQGPTLEFFLGILEAALFLTLAGATWRHRPTLPEHDSERSIAAGILWFVITILPVSNLFFLSGVLLAERTLYTPSVGFALGIGWLGARIARRTPTLAGATLAAALAAMSLRTVTRNPTWHDTASVIETLIAEHPESGRAQWILGNYYVQTGRIDEGIAAYRRALQILGYHYPLITDFGRDLINQGQDEEAERMLRHAWQVFPDFARAPFLLTVLYARQQRWQDARETALAALRADSADPVAHHLLANIYTALDSTEQAIRARRAAIRHGEGEHWQQWYWLAQALLRAGRADQAAAALDSARARTTSGEARRTIDALLQNPPTPANPL